MKTLRNKNDRSALIERLEQLGGDETPVWGKMTAPQMMSHLVQAGEMPFVSSVPDRSGFMSRTFIKPLILYVLPMPKEVKTSPEMNQQEKGRKPGEFTADRNLLIKSMEKLGELPLDFKCLGHPFFGKMSAKEWAGLAHNHIDHHLRQFGQ